VAEDRRQAAYFIPHGGGPCFFMDDPLGAWVSMEAFLKSFPDRVHTKPKAIILVSAHWETDGFTLTGSTHPELVYDYYGFPAHTYQLSYPAPGDPDIAGQAVALLRKAGLKSQVDTERGLDHGVFVPLKVMFPDADIPVVEMSLDQSLDAAMHIAAGRALAELRDQNILIIGSGMSFHNMRGYRDPRFTDPSIRFDNWLADVMGRTGKERDARLVRWEQDAPDGRLCHPREEHLLPAMVVAGTSQLPASRVFGDLVLDTANSGFCFP
jgi:aromatic ring-opening dioxygenase catalytic subunit (LigB family)